MKWLTRLHGWCNRHEWLLVFLLAVVVLRIPSLLTPHFYGDEEIYFVMGRAWREGVPLYQAMFDHKPPLIYVLAGIFNTVPLFRGMLLAMMLLHTVLFWKLASRFWGSEHPYLAKLSVAIFVLLTSLPTLEGLIVNAELLMMLPVTASLLLAWSAKRNDWQRMGAAGLLAGLGWLYKIPVMFDAAAIGLYLFVFRPKDFRGSLRGIVSPGLWAYALAFVLPLALTFGYYYLKGHGSDYLDTVLTMNLGYVSSWSTSTYAFNPFRSGLVVRGTGLLGLTLLLYLLRHKLDRRITLGALWLAWAGFGALLSYRPYPHYLQEMVPALALLLPSIFLAERVAEWVTLAILIGAGGLIEKDVKFWGYPTLSVYRDAAASLRGRIAPEEYRSRFDNTRRNYAIADYLNERLGSEDKIYVWGTDPTIYNLTKRLPTGGKYIVSFHVHDLKQEEYTMTNLLTSKPKAVVVLTGSEEFPALTGWLEMRYISVMEYEGNAVYWRIGSD